MTWNMIRNPSDPQPPHQDTVLRAFLGVTCPPFRLADVVQEYARLEYTHRGSDGDRIDPYITWFWLLQLRNNQVAFMRSNGRRFPGGIAPGVLYDTIVHTIFRSDGEYLWAYLGDALDCLLMPEATAYVSQVRLDIAKQLYPWGDRPPLVLGTPALSESNQPARSAVALLDLGEEL